MKNRITKIDPNDQLVAEVCKDIVESCEDKCIKLGKLYKRAINEQQRGIIESKLRKYMPLINASEGFCDQFIGMLEDARKAYVMDFYQKYSGNN